MESAAAWLARTVACGSGASFACASPRPNNRSPASLMNDIRPILTLLVGGAVRAILGRRLGAGPLCSEHPPTCSQCRPRPGDPRALGHESSVAGCLNSVSIGPIVFVELV